MPTNRVVQLKKRVAQAHPPNPRELELAEYTTDMIEQLERMLRRMGRVRTASLLRAACKSAESDLADLQQK